MASNTETAAPAQPSKMFPVILSKNYQPIGKFEVVGYVKPAVTRKDKFGQMKTISAEEFIKGEMKPPKAPGTGYDGKVWAGTKILLPVDEAKKIIAKKIGERADDIAA